MAGEKIRIEDLRRPVLSDMQKAALGFAESNPVELTRKAVLGAAVESTGLEDFGPDDFHDRHDLVPGRTRILNQFAGKAQNALGTLANPIELVHSSLEIYILAIEA